MEINAIRSDVKLRVNSKDKIVIRFPQFDNSMTSYNNVETFKSEKLEPKGKENYFKVTIDGSNNHIIYSDELKAELKEGKGDPYECFRVVDEKCSRLIDCYIVNKKAN